MNKKFFAGMMTCGIAVSFWACGSGDICKPSGDDGLIGTVEGFGVNPGYVTEVNCPACFAGVSSSAVKPSSSSVFRPPQQSSSSYSSSSEIIVNLSSSSSSIYVPPTGSSSSTGTVGSSSSAQTQPGNDLGSCSPKPAIAEIGEDVVWSYTRGSAVQSSQLTKATYGWTFEGGTQSSVSVIGANGISQRTKYTTSGDHGAQLLLSMGNTVYPITCSPVHVNGAAITGCKCTAADKKPDVSAGASWSVTGCSSVGADIVGYEWNGATVADPTTPNVAVLALAEKGITAAPTVRVSNNDHSYVDVTCDEIVSVDSTSPDYVFEIVGNQIKSEKLAVKNEGCMIIKGSWTDTWNSPTVKVLCDGTAADQSVGMTFTMTYNSKEIATGSGTWGFSNLGGEIGKITAGEVSFTNICVSFTGAETITCSMTN